MRHTTDIRWFFQLITNCEVELSAAQTVPNGSLTVVAFDSVRFDNLGEFDAVNHRFVASFNGYLSFCVRLTWGASAAADWRSEVFVMVGASNRASTSSRVFQNLSTSTNVSGVTQVVAGNFVTVQVINWSSSAKQISFLDDQTQVYFGRVPFLA